MNAAVVCFELGSGVMDTVNHPILVIGNIGTAGTPLDHQISSPELTVV